jgi:integrase
MVTAKGYRAFYLIYRARGIRKGRAYCIGPAEDLSYREAVRRAEEVRGHVAAGRDPFGDERAAAERKRSTTIVTLRDALDYFIDVHRKHHDSKTSKGYEQTRSALPSHFLREPAENLTPALFRQSIKEVTSAPVMHNRHLSRVKAALRFAHAEQYMSRLPALVSMKKPHSERKRQRVLSGEEIRAAWEALETIAPTMPRGGRAFLASVRVALLVGVRLGETSEAEWTEFDLDGTSPRSKAVPERQPMWYIPAGHRKGQKDKKVEHWVPLPPLAVSNLGELQPITGDKPKVFWKAGYTARTYMIGKLVAEMRRRGFVAPFSFHDLRRTCSTGLGELGCPAELNDLILGHVRRGVLAHYDHSKRIAERAEWLQRWADEVAAMIGLPPAEATPSVHLYERRDGLPEIRLTREAANGRRYLGAFKPLEATRKVEELMRHLSTAR